MKRQAYGELDDSRLVEGVTSDKYIYKRRGELQDTSPIPESPKIISFVLDVSGSMYRFNGMDERLERCMEVALLVMESFAVGNNQPNPQFEIQIVGHSGDSPSIPLVDFGALPTNEKERMKILRAMIAHSQYCQAGDHTLEAMSLAVETVQQNDSKEDKFVICISDANLQRYRIAPSEIGDIIEQANQHNVKAHYVAIASFGKEADRIKKDLPIGRGHVCMQTSELPKVIRDLLSRINE